MPSSPRGNLPAFFLITLLVTWASWWTAHVVGGTMGTGLSMLFLHVGIFAPAFVAIALTAHAGGRAAVITLVRPLVQWNVGVRWYLFAVFYMIVIKLASASIHRVVSGEWPRFGSVPFVLMLLSTLLSTATLGQAGEELGWRGYALPRLADRISMRRASILLGVVWAVWHLPLFYIPGADTTGQSFPLYLVHVTAMSVAIAWLYQRTHGSLLITMLMHAAINNTKDIVPGVPQAPSDPFSLNPALFGWVVAGVMWVVAAVLLFRMPARSDRDVSPH